MGARFTQYLALMEPGGHRGTAARRGSSACSTCSRARSTVALPGPARAGRRPGRVRLLAAGRPSATLRAARPAGLNVFEKRYVRAAGHRAARAALAATSASRRASPFLGDPDAVLKVLLPTDPAFDLAVNVFTYQPGATLPMVEVHVMEHGLLMLEGQGVYRLGDDWYPVRQGDVIWMAPYCPQWFVAMGKEPARYLYYKDVNRDPMEETGMTPPRAEVDVDRVMAELDALAAHERRAEPPAVTRVALHRRRPRGPALIKELCAEAGLTVREDAVGNTFARWEGPRPDLPAVATGSHIDAIPHSGRFDGTVGVLGGLEAIRALRRGGFRARAVDRADPVHQRGADAVRHRLPGQPGALPGR